MRRPSLIFDLLLGEVLAVFALPVTFVSSEALTVGETSTMSDTTMVSGVQYVLRGTVDLWWRAGVYVEDPPAPVAAVTDGSHFLPAGATALVAGGGLRVAVIRASSDGHASLSQIGPG